jgi:pimeloyl-ACP methyl ester carboxylesterase
VHQAPGSVALSELARAGVRVLILHGDQDALVPVANSVRLARQVPNAQLVVLPQCGHNPQEEQPEALLEAVTRWWGERD